MSLIDEIKKYLPAAGDDLCDQWMKSSQFELEFLRFYKLMVTEELTPGPQIVEAFCGSDCANGGEGGCPLDIPSFVSATDGTEETGVVVSWGAVSGATYYDIYRSVDNNSANAVKINNAPEPALTFLDSFPASDPDTQYFYFVKAVRTNGVTGTILCESEFSNADSGYCHTGGGAVGAGSRIFTGLHGKALLIASHVSLYSTTQFTFVVPAGKTSILVKAWAGGGAAGFNNIVNGGNGGGGGGEYAEATVAVTAGETLYVRVGSGGSIYLPAYAQTNGYETRIYRLFNSPLVLANGGKLGSDGNPATLTPGAGGIGGLGRLFGAGTSGTSGANGLNGASGNFSSVNAAGGAAGVTVGTTGVGGSATAQVGNAYPNLGGGGRVEISWA